MKPWLPEHGGAGVAVQQGDPHVTLGQHPWQRRALLRGRPGRFDAPKASASSRADALQIGQLAD
jgi:hypothetical protein